MTDPAVTVEETGVESFLERLAAPSASAGGGAAAALTAASAAALVAMVAGIAARHGAGDAPGIAAEADTLRRRLTDVIGLDVEAYGRVLAARRRRDGSRAAALRDALVAATEIPLEVAAAGVRILELCAAVAGGARRSTAADLGVAGVLAAAAADGAAVTARANLETLDAADFVADARRRLEALRADAEAHRARLARAFPPTITGAEAASR